MKKYEIVKIDVDNYYLFSDMVHWRMTGKQGVSSNEVTDDIKDELLNPNLYLYAVKIENSLVGWISLIYMPKVGKFNGHGHVYIDELWVESSYRNSGLAKALMQKADELAEERKPAGIRLYVNVDNPIAQNLYEKCGYSQSCTANLLEKLF